MKKNLILNELYKNIKYKEAIRIYRACEHSSNNKKHLKNCMLLSRVIPLLSSTIMYIDNLLDNNSSEKCIEEAIFILANICGPNGVCLSYSATGVSNCPSR